MLGIMMSRSMQSGRRAAICASAFGPSSAVITSKPRPASIRAVMRVAFSLSSTTMIVSGIALSPSQVDRKLQRGFRTVGLT
jgi:hypothetical protein